MSVVSAIKKITVNVKLNNGTKNGTVNTLTVSLGDMNEAGFDAQKVMNIVNVLGDCLDKPVYSIEKVEVSTLSEDD